MLNSANHRNHSIKIPTFQIKTQHECFQIDSQYITVRQNPLGLGASCFRRILHGLGFWQEGVECG